MRSGIRRVLDTNTAHGKIIRAIIFFALVAVVFLLSFFIMQVTGLWEKINSMDKMRQFVQNGGIFSFLIFMLLQILQTTILQIPAVFVTIVGALIFGKWQAFFMSYIAILIGSIIMFWIGRRAGRRFLYWIIGEDGAERWINRMNDGKYLFFLMMLFPMFPDDILCVVAGLTDMSFSFFLWTNILARGLGIICTVFFGSGSIIPFHGWGIAVWAVIGVIVLILFYISIRYKDKIDDALSQMTMKRHSIPHSISEEKQPKEFYLKTISDIKKDKK